MKQNASFAGSELSIGWFSFCQCFVFPLLWYIQIVFDVYFMKVYEQYYKLCPWLSMRPPSNVLIDGTSSVFLNLWKVIKRMIESFKTFARVAIVWKSLPSIIMAKTKKQIYSLLSYVWNWLWVLRKLPFSRLGKPRNRDCRFASFAARSNRLVVILRSHLSPKMSEIDGRLTYLVWNQSRFNTKDRLISTSCL